jgi:hypothetical protein
VAIVLSYAASFFLTSSAFAVDAESSTLGDVPFPERTADVISERK